MPRSALLVIDMQNDLCRDSRRKQKVDLMLPSLKKTIELFSHNKQLILYSCFALKETDEQFERFGDRYCIEGSKGADIIVELQPLKGGIIYKKKHSAFFETELDRILREDDVSDLYLTGLQTQICIMTTAADASFRGYRAVAISDCVLSTREENKDSALQWIAKYVGEVRTLDEIIKEIEGNAIS